MRALLCGQASMYLVANLLSMEWANTGETCNSGHTWAHVGCADTQRLQIEASMLHKRSLCSQVLPSGWNLQSINRVKNFYAYVGLSNDCLVASSHPLAVRYNDLSVSENHHCCTFTQ